MALMVSPASGGSMALPDGFSRFLPACLLWRADTESMGIGMIARQRADHYPRTSKPSLSARLRQRPAASPRNCPTTGRQPQSHSNNHANCGMTTRTFQMKTKSQPDREPSRALASAWIKAGCPEKLTVHVGTQIFYLLDGKLVDYPAFALRCPNTRVQQKP